MKILIVGFADGFVNGKSTICAQFQTLLEPLCSVTLINGDCFCKTTIPETIAPCTGKGTWNSSIRSASILML